MPTTARIAHIFTGSVTNGPGARTVIWFQGCSLACPGCWNPELWPEDGGEEMTVDEVMDRIEDPGVTLTGGEPFDQIDFTCELIERCHERDITVLVFTGYTRDELAEVEADEDFKVHMEADALIMGRFECDNPSRTKLLGSTNQICVDNTGVLDWVACGEQPDVEVVAQGPTLFMTGFPDQGIVNALKKTGVPGGKAMAGIQQSIRQGRVLEGQGGFIRRGIVADTDQPADKQAGVVEVLSAPQLTPEDEEPQDSQDVGDQSED